MPGKMLMTPVWISRAAAVAASAGLLACSLDTAVPDEVVSSNEAAIINGAATVDPKYAAVGALVYSFPDVGVLDVFCSGTLVAQGAVVTARHCTGEIDVALASGLVPAVAFGADPFNPTHLIPITGYVNAPAAPGLERGLLLDGGRDVAVAYIESAPAGITPARLGEFQESMIGTKFEIAGFGRYDAQGSYGPKHAGTVTARATHGKWYELLFGTYDAFRSWYFVDALTAAPTEAEAKEWWSVYKLENNYELLAGGLAGESVACNGDSGGPLLRGTQASNLTTYGVSFAVERSKANFCAFGGAYLVFNRTMLAFVRGAL